jgi:hypothetical protein
VKNYGAYWKTVFLTLSLTSSSKRSKLDAGDKLTHFLQMEVTFLEGQATIAEMKVTWYIQ